MAQREKYSFSFVFIDCFDFLSLDVSSSLTLTFFCALQQNTKKWNVLFACSCAYIPANCHAVTSFASYVSRYVKLLGFANFSEKIYFDFLFYFQLKKGFEKSSLCNVPCRIPK